MESFTGSAVHTIDPKGRVFIPTNYREALGSDFTIALNNDLRTIAMYPREIWREKCEAYGRIPDAEWDATSSATSWETPTPAVTWMGRGAS